MMHERCRVFLGYTYAPLNRGAGKVLLEMYMYHVHGLRDKFHGLARNFRGGATIVNCVMRLAPGLADGVATFVGTG